MTRLYADLAAWWPLMSAPEEYLEEAAFYRSALRSYRSTIPSWSRAYELFVCQKAESAGV